MDYNVCSQKRKHVESKKIKYLKSLVTRILLSFIFLLCALISMKIKDNNKKIIEKKLLTENMSFTKINKLYQKYFGNIIPTIDTQSELVFSENNLINTNYSNYENGIKIEVKKGEPITSLYGGIVVYIGNKDNYGHTIIIQGNDGVDYWYCNITNINVSLYDYIEKGLLLGEANNEYFYLVLQKNGNYLKYEDVI